MKKKFVASAIAVIAAALMNACIDGVPANPFLQAPIKTDDMIPQTPQIPQDAAYTIVIDMIDNAEGDTLTAAPKTGGEGDIITLEFTVANIAHYNLLDFGGVNAPIDSVDSAGSGSRIYTINANDASNGKIIIIATFEHTDLTPDPLTFADTSPVISKTYGDANFTNAICAEHSGSGAVTYSSSDEGIAEVDNNGEVRIRAAGSAVITANKAADAVYAHASASYTLIIEPLAVTLTVTVANKIYDHTLNADVTGATINGNLDGGNLTVIAGTAAFADANAGNNKTVTFSGWSLGGSAAGNYTLPAQPASTTANITKANPAVTWPTGLTAISGQTLANISLPGNGSGVPAGAFAWTTPSNSVGAPGTQSHSMTFTPNDTTNYNTVTQDMSIAVSAATYTLTVNRSPAAGGTVSVNGNPSGSAAFTEGTVVSLAATANNGYTFTGWSVTGGSVASASSASTTITMNGNATVTATFQPQGTDSVSVDMAWVPGGSFQMGDAGYDYSRPVHTVTLTGFYMGKYEVTQKQWYEVMGTTQQELQTAAAPANSADYGKGDNNPVYYVSWYDAVEFCNALSEMENLTPYYTINKTTGSDPDNASLSSNDPYRWLVTRNTSAAGYRLPTEAQWEYAAKGGDGSPGNYTYAGSNNADTVAWYNNNDGPITKEVGTKAPNGLGLYDLSGNVWEWCWDWYSAYEDSEQTDPTGPSAGRDRVLRGGGWYGTADSVRSAYRGSIYPSVRSIYRGFRVVRPGQ